MFSQNCFNPYSKQISNVGKQFLKYQVNDTYNTKVKSYPDGTFNFCFSSHDIFGRDERNYSIKSHAYLNFKKTAIPFYINSAYEYQSFERDDVLHQIEVFYKSVDNYLIFCQQGRDFDKRLNFDACVWSDSVLSLSERSFVNSLRSSLRKDNLKRAKDTIFDLVSCNEWTFFFTGTIDPKKYDSNNVDKLKPKLRKWFNNMVERYSISYICIFEYHKKGGIHLHGLIKENPFYPLRLVDSGTKSYFGFKKPMRDRTALKHGLDVSKGHVVYNLSTWKFGFSTAIRCYGSQGSLSSYMTKYITKSNQKIMGRYFWHSQDLKRPTTFYINSQYDKLPLSTFHGFKYLYESSHDNQNNLYSDWVTLYDESPLQADLSDYVDIL